MHLLVQAAAEGHVHFLEAAADAEHRHAGGNRRTQQGQGGGIALRVVGGARLAGSALVMEGFDIGWRAGKQQPIHLP